MSLEPTLFDSPMFETANETLLFCRDFIKESAPTAADRLSGLEPISTPVMGRLAVGVLLELRPEVGERARAYIDLALSALYRALYEPACSAVA